MDGAPQLLSCFTAACKPAMHPALDMQRQEAHPGSRAAVAGSRQERDCLLIPRSPCNLLMMERCTGVCVANG